MISAPFVIMINSIREMIRDRTFSVIFFGALILVMLSFFLGSLSLDEQRRILVHLGFGTIHLSALGVVLFQGANSLQREIDKQTCLMVLARPVSRFQFLLGLWLAVMILLLVHLLVQSACLSLLLEFAAPWERFTQILMGIYIEMAVILGFVFFVVQWVRPIIATFSGLGLFLIANWIEELKFFSEKSKDSGLQALAKVIENGVPNTYLLNFRSEAFLFQGLERTTFTFEIILHFFLWVLLFLILAGLSFQRRDLV